MPPLIIMFSLGALTSHSLVNIQHAQNTNNPLSISLLVKTREILFKLIFFKQIWIRNSRKNLKIKAINYET